METLMSTITVYAPTATRRAPRPAPTSTGTRLTRRGRLAVFLTALLLIMLALVAIAGAVTATSQAGDPTPARNVQVTSGDTLWDIAAAANSGGNVGATMHDIAELNGLSQTGALQVGQQIAVPLY